MTTNLDDLPQSSAQSSVQSNVQLNITEQNVKMDNPIKDLEQRRNDELKQAPVQTKAASQPASAPQGEGNQIDINSFVTGLQQAAAKHSGREADFKVRNRAYEIDLKVKPYHTLKEQYQAKSIEALAAFQRPAKQP